MVDHRLATAGQIGVVKKIALEEQNHQQSQDDGPVYERNRIHGQGSRAMKSEVPNRIGRRRRGRQLDARSARDEHVDDYEDEEEYEGKALVKVDLEARCQPVS